MGIFKGWRTVLFGAVVAAVGGALSYFEELKGIIGQCATDPSTNEQICSLPGWTGPVLGLVIIGLRALTKTSIFSKE